MGRRTSSIYSCSVQGGDLGTYMDRLHSRRLVVFSRVLIWDLIVNMVGTEGLDVIIVCLSDNNLLRKNLTLILINLNVTRIALWTSWLCAPEHALLLCLI